MQYPKDELRKVIVAFVILTILSLLVLSYARKKTNTPEEITYTQLIHLISNNQIDSVFVVPQEKIVSSSKDAGKQFNTVYPIEDFTEILEIAKKSGVVLSFEKSEPRDWSNIFSVVLQIVLLLFLLKLLFSHNRGFGNVDNPNKSELSFKDVAGTDGASEELKELVLFLQDPEDFIRVGARVPKGALLYGPPGTGKTLLAKAVAGEANTPFFYVSGAEVTGFIVGMGARKVKNLFKKAKKSGGVIFIDEIDAIGGLRGRNQSHNEDDRTLNQLLVEMDGFTDRDGVVVIGATNRPDILDPALKRPGRFDRQIVVGLPSMEERSQILHLHVEKRGIPLHADFDIQRIALLMPSASGADLANLLNESAIVAAKNKSAVVKWDHFEQARDRVLLGRLRSTRSQEKELKIVAYHEAGHALAGVLFCPEDGLHKVSIQSRGQSLGVAYFSPEDNQHLYSKKHLRGQIMKGLAGRAAEEIVFGMDNVTSGAENDFTQVNRIARRMICSFGMGHTLLVKDPDSPLSKETEGLMDKSTEALLAESYEVCKETLFLHRDVLDSLATALLLREIIDGEEALEIIKQTIDNRLTLIPEGGTL